MDFDLVLAIKSLRSGEAGGLGSYLSELSFLRYWRGLFYCFLDMNMQSLKI